MDDTNAAASTEPRTNSSPSLGRWEVAAMLLVCAAMTMATALRTWPITWTEVLGFATGGICVWLIVRENLWNWPIGLFNNVIFFVLFWQGRLFADAWLQVLYFGLGVYGWWNWMRGGQQQSRLIVSRTTRWEWLLLLATTPLAVLGLRWLLLTVQGAAPMWDSLTTVLSIAAQYLLCRKRLEHWLIWIVADVIYVPLYLARGLPLTAALYAVFLLMCIVGLVQWRRQWIAYSFAPDMIPQTAVGR